MRQRKKWVVWTLVLSAACVALAAWACAHGAALYLVAEPNTCTPQRYLPPPRWQIDPNAIVGELLPPRAGDPNDWSVPCGPFTRTAPACDPDGDPFEIEFAGGTSPATVVFDPNAATWTITAEAGRGANVWVVTARDRPVYADPCEASFTIWAWGEPPANHAPILY